MDSVIPFHYVDLEIWLNSELGIEFIGLEKEESNWFQEQISTHLAT